MSVLPPVVHTVALLVIILSMQQYLDGHDKGSQCREQEVSKELYGLGDAVGKCLVWRVVLEDILIAVDVAEYLICTRVVVVVWLG